MTHDLCGGSLQDEGIQCRAVVPALITNDRVVFCETASIILGSELLRILYHEGHMNVTLQVACASTRQPISSTIVGPRRLKLGRVGRRRMGIERRHEKDGVLLFAVYETVPFAQSMHSEL